MRVVVVFLSVLFFSSACSAESLWSGATVKGSSLFVDQLSPDLEVNDIVVILIDEKTTAKADADTEVEMEDTVDGSISNWFSIEDAKNILDLLLLNNNDIKTQNNTTANLPKWGLSIKNEFSGEGETVRNNQVVAKIPARIIAMEPNGNIVLEGKKKVKVNQETTILTITGVARAEDVTSDNTIASSVIAELAFSVDGKGLVNNVNRQGLLSKIFNLIR